MGELQNKFLDLSFEQIREKVKRTIKSYRNSWDIYTELIQNSVDAIIDKFGFENISQGKIKIEIDSSKRRIVIEDNGVGIKPNELSSIIVLGESLKRKNNKGKYGFMGYGFTFVAFQTEYLEIESVFEKEKATRTYKNLYKFIFDNNVEMPLSEEEKNCNTESIEIENTSSYTKITVQFPECFPEETIENNIKSGFYYTLNAKLMEFILRRKSAIGITDSIFSNEKLFEVDLLVDGEKYYINSGYLTTKELIEREFNKDNFFSVEEYTDWYNQTEKNLNGDAKERARSVLLIDCKKEDIIIGTQDALNARFYMTSTSKNHLNEYTKKFPNEQGIDNLRVENGIWLAIDGLPTSICLDKFEHPNFLPYTVVVDILDKKLRDDLDGGRKGITRYRAEQIRDKVKEVLSEIGFNEYRQYVVGTKSRIDIDDYDPREELSNKMESKSRYNEVDLCHKFFPPVNEQDVITLFIELISKNYIKGYKPKINSSYDVYDGLYEYGINLKDSLIYPDDPLGLARTIKQQTNFINKRSIIIEYKLKLSHLFRDINDLRKNLNQIDILVCWDVEFENKESFLETQGAVLSTVEQRNNIYYGVTHQVVSAGAMPLKIIELKTVINIIFNLDL